MAKQTFTQVLDEINKLRALLKLPSTKLAGTSLQFARIIRDQLRQQVERPAKYDIRIDERQRHALFYAVELLHRLPASALVLQDPEEVKALRDMLMPPADTLPEPVRAAIAGSRGRYAYPDIVDCLMPTDAPGESPGDGHSGNLNDFTF